MRTDKRGSSIQVGRWNGAPTTLALSTSSDRVQLAANTVYRLWSSVDCFVRFGDVSVAATTSSSPLTAKISELAVTHKRDTYIAGIVSSGTGTLFITPIDADQAPSA